MDKTIQEIFKSTLKIHQYNFNTKFKVKTKFKNSKYYVSK